MSIHIMINSYGTLVTVVDNRKYTANIDTVSIVGDDAWNHDGRMKVIDAIIADNPDPVSKTKNMVCYIHANHILKLEYNHVMSSVPDDAVLKFCATGAHLTLSGITCTRPIAFTHSGNQVRAQIPGVYKVSYTDIQGEHTNLRFNGQSDPVYTKAYKQGDVITDIQATSLWQFRYALCIERV